MNKDDYLSNIQGCINEILRDPVFIWWKNQLVAKKLWSEFNCTYREDFLWNKILYLSTNSCTLLLEWINERLANEALKICWKVYEDFSLISEKYDKDYCLILSALCYDLSWYQANAYCLVKKLSSEYTFESSSEDTDITIDNYILRHIQQILLKNIPKGKTIIDIDLEGDVWIKKLNLALNTFYDNILNWSEGDFLTDINQSYEYFLENFNIPISLLILLVKTRLKKYLENSIWRNLNYSSAIKNNKTWQRYIKLLTNDLYENNGLKNISKRRSVFELWISQLRAIEAWLLVKDKNFVIQMPTSAWKTFIAEISILNNLINHPWKKCIYIAPYKALTWEKEEELSKNLSKLWFSVSTLSWSYEIDEYQNLLIEETDILIATPEKIDLLFRINKKYFDNISYIVIDEWHIVWDISTRASLLEFLIIRLKIKAPHIKMLFISAVMPSSNADDYSSWLNNWEYSNVIRALQNKDDTSENQWEPTQKIIWIFSWQWEKWRIDFEDIYSEDENTKTRQGAFVSGIIDVKKYWRVKFPKKDNKSEVAVSLALSLTKDKGWTFIFCGKRNYVESVAKKFIELSILENNQKSVLSESYFYSKEMLWENHIITQCINNWIGVHFWDLPEQIRRSVENDFRNGILKILISTNTISQWINLPIKNIIFHSIDLGKGIKITTNDFKNIIGRAWRAWMETEWQIIFITWENYSKVKWKLEPANSLFINVLKELIEKRIDKHTYLEYISMLSEPYLFDLMAEESLTESMAIEKIIDNSLFKIQIEKEPTLDINTLRGSFTDVFYNIKGKVANDKLETYWMTWFSLKSNDILYFYIMEHIDELKTIIENNEYEKLLENIFLLLSEKKDDILEVKDKALTWEYKIYLDLLKKWISWYKISLMREEWLKIDNKVINLYILMSKWFDYRFSWWISAFLTITSYCLGIELKSFPTDIKNLVWYLKYWTNNPYICLARSVWIKSRESAKYIFENFQKTIWWSQKDFLKYISNISYEDIERMDISDYDKTNVNNVSLRLRPKNSIIDNNWISFRIVGTYYKEERKNNSLEIWLWDKLSLRRELTNKHDPYALLVYNWVKEVWYVWRDLSKKLSLDIDLWLHNYEITVEHIDLWKWLNTIWCRLTTVNE